MRQLNASPLERRRAATVRDWAAAGFRHGRLIVLSFLIVFAGVLLVTWILPRQYQAQVKFLVKGERVDTLVSPDQNTQAAPPDLTEQGLNSEVELLRSRDLLERVVVASGLASGNDARISLAARGLEKSLKVEPLKKTNLIQVRYTATDPQQAMAVLQALTRLYFDKHLEVHRTPGTLDFFRAQTEDYRKDMEHAQQRVSQFANKEGVVSAELDKELTVRKLSEFEAELGQTRAAITETERRIATLEEQQAVTPSRLTTQVRKSDNPLLLQQLKSTLLSLELKRTDLLSKFTSNYPPVQEVETEIAQTREALASAETNQVREETTDRDTTHEWLKGELAKARSELSALRGRVAATLQNIAMYRGKARQLNETQIAQQGLLRSAKTAEDNFLLYSRKQEEARISDALDRQRIVNVSVAEAATLPILPSNPGWTLNILLGFLLALLVSITLGLAADYLDSSFRTPDEVEVWLDVPVLAFVQVSQISTGE